MATHSVAVTSPRVLADLIPAATPARELARDMALMLGGAAAIGASAQVSIAIPAISPVPFVLTTLTVLLLGAAYGPVRAAGTLGLYLVAGMAGVPWFTDGGSGAGIVTLGYVIGFLAAGIAVGALARHGGDKTVFRTAGLMVVGNLVIYSCGVPYLAVAADMSAGDALWHGATVFIITDLIKLVAAAALLPGTWSLLDRFGS